MKKILFIIFILFNLSLFSQENVELNQEEIEFNNFINYKPKFYVSTLDKQIKSNYKGLELNSISFFYFFYSNQEYFKLTKQEVKELENEINQLVVAFFLEGKPIFIKKVGGYDGCPDEMIYIENRNDFEIIILNFCFTCSGASEFEEKFIYLVNNRTEKLIK